MISSDVLSRGIDVQNIDVVFNYDKPQNERLFVHRVGRTARCGKEGAAVSVVLPDEVCVDPLLFKIVRIAGFALRLSTLHGTLQRAHFKRQI